MKATKPVVVIHHVYSIVDNKQVCVVKPEKKGNDHKVKPLKIIKLPAYA